MRRLLIAYVSDPNSARTVWASKSEEVYQDEGAGTTADYSAHNYGTPVL